MKTSGVYVIYLKNTMFAYVGESSNIAARFYNHSKEWAYPNDVELVVAREMPGSTTIARRKTEAALARLLRRRGYLLLSTTYIEQRQHHSEAMKVIHAKRSREERSAKAKVMAESSKHLSPEQKLARTLKARQSPARLQGIRRRWTQATPLERKSRTKAAIASVSSETRAKSIGVYNSRVTAEQRRENAILGWKKRRARKAGNA